MKMQLKLLCSAGTVLATLALPLQAQNATSADEATYARQRLMETRDQLQNCAVKASQVMGMKLENCQNQKLGKIEDMGLDLASGRIVTLIVSRGGFAGIDETTVAVPPSVLKYDLANNNLKLDVSAEKFQKAPVFNSARWVESMSSNQVVSAYTYFDAQPWFASTEAGKPLEVAGERAMQKRQTDLESRNLSAKITSPFSPSEVRSESKFLGCPVMDAQLENVGKVADCIVDVSAGRVLAVVVSPATNGKELETYPATAFDFGQTNDTIVLNDGKALISGNTSDSNQASSSQDGHEAIDKTTFITPLDQGNDHVDLITTAQIRKEIIADTTLSVNAKNVKIITRDGHVTLRGPVANIDEKQRVEEIANHVAHSENVTDQLIVAQNPTTSMNH